MGANISGKSVDKTKGKFSGSRDSIQQSSSAQDFKFL